MRNGASLGLEQGRSSGGGERSAWAPIAKSMTSLSQLGPLPLSPILVRSTPIHAARPDRILFVVVSHSSSENAAWLHSPRSTSCRSFSPGRSASPLTHLRPPRARALRPTLSAQAVFDASHSSSPSTDALRPSSRKPHRQLPTISRPPPTVRPPLNALVLVLTSRSVPGAAGRSVQKRTGGCLSPAAASHLHRTRYPGTRWAQWAGSVRGATTSGGRAGSPGALPAHESGVFFPFYQTSDLSSPPATILVLERARGTLRARHDGE
jgi:hypothetical protein